jgi:hypothetical protein
VRPSHGVAFACCVRCSFRTILLSLTVHTQSVARRRFSLPCASPVVARLRFCFPCVHEPSHGFTSLTLGRPCSSDRRHLAIGFTRPCALPNPGNAREQDHPYGRCVGRAR